MEQLNSVIDFETAKLLSDKGFELDSYLKIDDVNPKNLNSNFNPKEYQPWYLTLTIAQTIDWIYNKHGIWINVEVSSFNTNTLTNERRIFLDYTIYSPKENIFIHEEDKDKIFNSPKEAYIEAIKYVLTKMI